MKISKRASHALAFVFLGTAGIAHAAAIANFNVDIVDSISVPIPGGVQSASGHGAGTATLDDSGFITIHATDTSTIYWGSNNSYIYTTVAETTFSGTWSDSGKFTPISGQPNWTSCVDSGTGLACQFIFPSSSGAATFGSVVGELAISGGSLATSLLQFGGIQVTSSTYTFTPAVPIPAAAWLFGSTLIGMVGAARKRLSA